MTQPDPSDHTDAPPSVDVDAIRATIDMVTQKVPWIGTAWRWYDVPYRICDWLLSGWRRKILRPSARTRVNRLLNFFIPFNEHDRHKAEPLDDPMHNLLIPEAESVSQGGVWVIEFFPPSHATSLRRSLDKNRWDRDSMSGLVYGSNSAQVAKARAGSGLSWWRLADVSNIGSGYVGSSRERLPVEFDLVEVAAVQVGPSLTAVIAFFRFGNAGSQCLDRAWHRQHEPRLTLRRLKRPLLEDRHFAGIHNTQAERLRLHDIARDWLAKKCPGVFAEAPGRHPAIDLTLFKTFDPVDSEPPRDLLDGLRALGLDEMQLHIYTSPQLPGFTLVPSKSDPQGSDVLSNCWSVCGARPRVDESTQDTFGYGDHPFGAPTIAAMYDDEVRSFLLYAAIERYLQVLYMTYARARDEAYVRHGRFRVRQLRKLREELLTTGLDLPAVAEDTKLLWDKRWRKWHGIEVTASEAPRSGSSPDPRLEFDVIETFGRTRAKQIDLLLAAEATYREVLASVAALGATIESMRTGRRALWVAGGSFVVALAALMLANTTQQTVLAEILARIGW